MCICSRISYRNISCTFSINIPLHPSYFLLSTKSVFSLKEYPLYERKEKKKDYEPISCSSKRDKHWWTLEPLRMVTEIDCSSVNSTHYISFNNISMWIFPLMTNNQPTKQSNKTKNLGSRLDPEGISVFISFDDLKVNETSEPLCQTLFFFFFH